MENRDLKAYAILFLAIIGLASAGGCGNGASYEDTLKSIDEIDARHNMTMDDYSEGMRELRYSPRFPPINTDDFEGIIEKFEALKSDVKDEPSRMMIDARIKLLESEKYYKLSKRQPLEGYIEDGFKCGDRPAIIEAVEHLNRSVALGREAIGILDDLNSGHSGKLNMTGIDEGWITRVNESFDDIAERAKKNERVINYFCLNNTKVNESLEEMYKPATEVVEEGEKSLI
ncbi:MAG: hypothetical protein R6U32_01920 [Candidatus Woesearchaeota archaeon]